MRQEKVLWLIAFQPMKLASNHSPHLFVMTINNQRKCQEHISCENTLLGKPAQGAKKQKLVHEKWPILEMTPRKKYLLKPKLSKTYQPAWLPIFDKKF